MLNLLANSFIDEWFNEDVPLIGEILFIGLFVGIIIFVLGPIFIGLITKKQEPQTKNDKQQTQNNETPPETNVGINYYRYQPDNQIVIQRSPEQQRIFDEYFVIKNNVIKKTPILAISVLALLLGIIFIAVSIVKDITALLVIGIIAIVASIILFIVYKKTITIFPKKIMTDAEYEALVNKKIDSLNVVKLGLAKLNLTAEQVQDIQPIILKDKVITETSLTVYNPKDKSLHSSTQSVFILYFTNEQLLVYKIQFDMCCNLQNEWTSEFFYKDICDLSTRCENNVLVFNNDKIEYSTLAVDIISSNSQIGFVMDKAKMDNESVQAMRQKLRDKKYA